MTIPWGIRVDQVTWLTKPAIVVPDPMVRPVLNPGEVFVIGDIRSTPQSGYPWRASLACDIDWPMDADLQLEVYHVAGEKISTVFSGRIAGQQPIRFTYRPDTKITQMIFYKMLINNEIPG